jgi:hypothetical protein
MAGEESAANAAEQNNGGQADVAERKRFKSEIEFPYSDLESALEVASTLHARAGTACEVTELAAWMNQSAGGGTFRSRMSAARLFGLVESGQGQVALTPLGRRAADKSDRAARAEALLNVPLYSAMYDQNRGNVLPPPAAVERQMVGLGVSPKQKDRARQIFVKSAQYAGFIDAGTGRFIKPGNAGKEDTPKPKDEEHKVGGGDDGTPPDLHPFIKGLLRELPPAGQQWPEAKRKLWLDTAGSIFKMIYSDDEAAH